MQAKLGDFFMKISALPSALQTHFFQESNDQVEFEDLLTTYMEQ